ncbi:MAG: hypothetical protein AAB570_03105, partial [Patescibacteria group bacterium]
MIPNPRVNVNPLTMTRRGDRNSRMSPPQHTWTDEEILSALEANPQDIRATLGLLGQYLEPLKDDTRRIVGLSGKVDLAIQ